jgi:hypothetical protein
VPDKPKTFWLAEYNGGYFYLTGKPSIGGGAAVCACIRTAQRFRTEAGCRAFIEEWDLVDRFTPHEFVWRERFGKA